MSDDYRVVLHTWSFWSCSELCSSSPCIIISFTFLSSLRFTSCRLARSLKHMQHDASYMSYIIRTCTNLKTQRIKSWSVVVAQIHQCLSMNSNFHLEARSHRLAVISNLMNLSTSQSTFPLKLFSYIILTVAHFIPIPSRSLRLTFPPPPASPPAPVCVPPAGLPGPLCWTSGSPLDETLCSSGLYSGGHSEKSSEVLNWTNACLNHNHISVWMV